MLVPLEHIILEAFILIILMIKVKMMHGDMILLSKDSQENNAPQ